MSTQHLLDHFASPKVPHWAKFQVIAHAEDGQHVKSFQGWLGAEREFRNQIGKDRDPKNYMIDKLLTSHTEEQAAALTAAWTLERHVGANGYFEVLDDYGRTVTIQRVDRE
jgi:hypothetical protein